MLVDVEDVLAVEDEMLLWMESSYFVVPSCKKED